MRADTYNFNIGFHLDFCLTRRSSARSFIISSFVEVSISCLHTCNFSINTTVCSSLVSFCYIVARLELEFRLGLIPILSLVTATFMIYLIEFALPVFRDVLVLRLSRTKWLKSKLGLEKNIARNHDLFHTTLSLLDDRRICCKTSVDGEQFMGLLWSYGMSSYISSRGGPVPLVLSPYLSIGWLNYGTLGH